MQKVLDYKKTVEEIKKAEYGKAKRILEDEKQSLVSIIEYKKHLNNQRKTTLPKTKVISLRYYNTYFDQVNGEIKKQENVIEKNQIELDQTKQYLIKATKERKIFEKLKDKQYDEYLYELKKEEDKFVDQIVSFSSYK